MYMTIDIEKISEIEIYYKEIILNKSPTDRTVTKPDL